MKTAILCHSALAILMCASAAFARQGTPPYSLGEVAKRAGAVPQIILPAIEQTVVSRLTDEAVLDGQAMPNKRLAISVGNEVDLNPTQVGQWQTLQDGSSLWRLQVQVPNATDLHLGFETWAVPQGAELWVIGALHYYEGPYTSDDEGPLWIPMVPGDTATLELRLPSGIDMQPAAMALTHVGGGFRDLFQLKKATGPGTSGACNINVICPLGDAYAAEQRALAYYEFTASDGFGYICTGTLLGNVAGTPKNYVLTAAHCMSTESEVRSMRVYWNYRSAQCAATTGYSFAQNQTGATLRATRNDADFSLVEMMTPPNPDWRLFHAGWDANGTPPSNSIGLHHPSGDVAKITSSQAAPRNYDNCIGTGGANRNTHWLSGPYNQGTTEGGSSGSGLWIPATDSSGRGKRLIGVLSGGNAMCSGSQPDAGVDCYGKFSAAFDGSSAGQRLRDWLDPAASGTRSIAGYENAAPAPVTDPLLAARIAADRQARDGRTSTRGVGAHGKPLKPHRSER